MKLSIAGCTLFLTLILGAGPSYAHYCSNIFAAHARLVVQAETNTVNISGGSATLKVFLQNNFPYKLNVEMRGNTTAYNVSVSPSSQKVSPGQKVQYNFTISGSGTVQVSQLNLQARIRIGGWQGESDQYVDPNPSQSVLVNYSTYGGAGEQSPSLNVATLADLYPSATLPNNEPFFGRTGIQQLAHWFGYRFCYSSGGGWRCSGENCPNPCAEGNPWTAIDQFPHNCMRAGVELGIRKAKLGSNLAYAKDAAVNAMQAGSGQHKCLAAVVGGHLWNGPGDTSKFETALNNVSSVCKAAGLRALGKGSQSNCSSGADYERAACAAAEGLRGNDGPVTSILIPNPNAADGESCDTGPDWSWGKCLYLAYMLYLVSGDRWAQGMNPTFYPAVGPPPPKQDTGAPPPPPPPPPDLGVPWPEGYIPPKYDVGWTPGTDGYLPSGDGSTTLSYRTLEGGCGCKVGDHRAPPLPAVGLIGLLIVFVLVRRKQ